MDGWMDGLRMRVAVVLQMSGRVLANVCQISKMSPCICMRVEVVQGGHPSELSWDISLIGIEFFGAGFLMNFNGECPCTCVCECRNAAATYSGSYHTPDDS